MDENGEKYSKTCPNVFRAFLHTFAKLTLDTDASVLSRRDTVIAHIKTNYLS